MTNVEFEKLNFGVVFQNCTPELMESLISAMEDDCVFFMVYLMRFVVSEAEEFASSDNMTLLSLGLLLYGPLGSTFPCFVRVMSVTVSGWVCLYHVLSVCEGLP